MGIFLTETPVDRDHPRDPPVQIPYGQRPPWTETPVDRDPPGQRPPGQRPPGPPWTETAPPPVTDTCENITSEKILSILALKAMVTCQ